MKKILNNLKPATGYHSLSNSIRKLFSFYGHELDEVMIFGLASALDFSYSDTRPNQLPHIYGRIKPIEFEDNLSKILNIRIKVRETVSKKKSMEELFNRINEGHPVIVYVDVAYIPYLNIPEFYHFGGHAIIVYGYDDEQEVFYISDRDSKGYKITMSNLEKPDDYHILTFDNLTLARSSKEKPMPPKNRWLSLDIKNIREVTAEMIIDSILFNVNNMLNDTLQNCGVEAIKYFSQKLMEWKNLNDEQLHHSAYGAFTMINKVGSTGGGCYRKIYGNFLREAGEMLDDDFLIKCGVEYLKIGDYWDEAANQFFTITNTLEKSYLNSISNKLLTIYLREKEILLRIKENLNNPKRHH